MSDVTRGGQFLVKETKCEDIFTPEDFNEEQLMMRDSVKEFVDKELWPNKDRFEKKDYALTEETMRKAGDLGFLSVAVPEAYGGMGMGFVNTVLVCDYISGATGSFSTAFGAHTGIGTMPITLYGTEEQKQKYVPKLASGEWFGAYCLLNQVLDQMPIQEKQKQFYLKTENHIPSQVKKCGFRMQVSVAYSSFLHVLEMIKTLLVLSLKTPMITEFQWEKKNTN